MFDKITTSKLMEEYTKIEECKDLSSEVKSEIIDAMIKELNERKKKAQTEINNIVNFMRS